jgi:ribosomal protein S18 acetylase RimI-like enzyme
MTPLHWRRAGNPDIQRLVELDARCFPPAARHPFEVMSFYVLHRRAITAVAETDRIVGMAVANAVGLRTAELLILCVDARWRRKGIGSRLLGRIEEQATRASLERIELEVDLDNAGAISFYEAAGFVTVGEGEGNSVDRLKLEKRLGD